MGKVEPDLLVTPVLEARMELTSEVTLVLEEARDLEVTLVLSEILAHRPPLSRLR